MKNLLPHLLKKTLPQSIALLFFVVLSCALKAQNNNQELTLVPVNFKVQSTSETGAKFVIDITNNSALTHELNLTIDNNISGIENPDDSNSSGNVELKFSFIDFNSKQKIESIQLNAGQTYRFILVAQSSDTTPLKRWNCSRLSINSITDPSVSSSLVLHTYVRDLTEE
mgnify:CR=1 FL=1